MGRPAPSPPVRDWQARMANTVLTFFLLALCFPSMVLSILAPFRRRPVYRSSAVPEYRDMDPAKARGFAVANAVLDGVTILYLIFL